MSKAFREKYGNKKFNRKDVREFVRPKFEYEADGVTPIYTTEQEHLKECDVNYIIKKYDNTKIIEHVAVFEHFYGDLSGDDFRSAVEKMQNCQRQFDSLPSDIRRRFENSPEGLLRFMEDPANREEGIKLGLISNASSPSSDGFGEHVRMASEPKKAVEPSPHKGEGS